MNKNEIKERVKHLVYGVPMLVMMIIIIGCSDSLYAQPVSGTINGHNYVDLGLPSGVLWATCNVGASSPSDYGNYYAWGEIKTKNSYNEANFNAILIGEWDDIENKMQNVDSTQRVSISSVFGDIASTIRDVANLDWKPAWRMPTKEDLYELIRKCTWTWVAIDGRNGYKVTGPNGNSIFLPAAGYREGKTDFGTGDLGLYWSSTSGGGETDCPWYLSINSLCYNVDITYRPFLGYPIRPVANQVIWKDIVGYYNDNNEACGGCSYFHVCFISADGTGEYEGDVSGVFLTVKDGDVIISGTGVDSSAQIKDIFRMKVKQYGKEVNNNSVWRRIYKGVSSYGTEATLVLDYKKKNINYRDNYRSIIVSAEDFHEESGNFDL